MKMDIANRDEALRCFHLAETCVADGNRLKAVRLLNKSLKLCPTDESKELLQRLMDDKNHCTDSDDGLRRRREEKPVPPGPRSRDYTDEQLAVVQRTNRCKNYYEVLDVTKDASDSDLKKQYRKLALQVHPDKNKAPGASEAFKAVGTAFAVLSDKEKRRQYDQFGPDGPQVENTHFYQNNHFHHGGRYRGFHDFDPDEIFNTFFGGRYGFTRDVYFPQQNHHHQHHEGPEANPIQLMLAFFLLMVPTLWLFSSLLEGPAFSLRQTGSYYNQRTTQTRPHPIRYYVQSDFTEKYGKSLGQIEVQVEREYISHLSHLCLLERQQRNHEVMLAKYYRNKAALDRATAMELPNCDRLQVLRGG